MSLWNITIDDTSPFLKYLPYADGSGSPLTTGWVPWYNETGFLPKISDGGSGESFHLTSNNGASVNFKFYGTAVYLFGSTNSSYDVSVDDKTSTFSSTTSSLLFSTTDLTEDTHSVTLTAKPSASQQQLGFDSAIISTPAVNGEIPSQAFYENTDTSVLQYSGAWTSASAPGIPNATFTYPFQKTTTQASVTMNIGLGAVGVSLWGLADWGNWVYSVSVDNTTNQYNGSTYWKVPDAMLYYQGGLDPTTNHTVTLSNISPGMNLELNSVRVYKIDAASAPSATTGTAASSASNSGTAPNSVSTSTPSINISSKHSVPAGAIVGPIVAVAVLAVLGWFLWRRNHRNRSPAQSTENMIESYVERPPHRPFLPKGASDVSGGPVSPTDTSTLTWTSLYSDPLTSPVIAPSSISAPSHDIAFTAPSSTLGQTSSTFSRDGKIEMVAHNLPSPTTPPAQRSPAPAATAAALSTHDVDRLVELIAQRIDPGRGNNIESAPPQYQDPA